MGAVAGVLGPFNIAEGAGVCSKAASGEFQRQWWSGGGDVTSAGPVAEEAGSADSAQTVCGELGGEGGAEGGPVVGWELGGASSCVAMALRRSAISRRLLVDRRCELE